MVRPGWRTLLSLMFLVAAAPLALAAQETEILRGKVTDKDGKPLEGATIVITGVQTQMARTVSTNRNGTYTSLMTSPEGEYLIAARRIGFAPKTVRVMRTGASAVIVTDFVLEASEVRLDSIVVTAKNLPTKDQSLGANDIDLLPGAIFSLDPADLLSLASSIPGVLSLGDSGFSVLGMGADQNNITIDGSSTSNAFLPRDAISSASLSLTPFDGGRGRFSGGQMSFRTRGGTDIFTATIRANGSDKTLAWQDPQSTSTIPRQISTSGSVGGPIQRGKAHFFSSFDIQNRGNDYYSLLSPRQALLEQTGLTRDTISALTDVLRDLGVPTNASAIPGSQTQNRASMFTRFDLAPSGTFSTKLQVNASRNVRGGSGVSQSAFPAAATQSRETGMSMQFQASGFVAGFMNELVSQVERNSSTSAPYLFIPGGSVRVGTLFDEGRTGLTTLRFGGGSGGERRNTSLTWDTNNEMSWITSDSRHRLKAGQNIRLERNESSQANNRYGTYTYQTMEDLRLGLPDRYSRTLTVRDRSSNGIAVAAWLGDDFRFTNNLQFQGSVRLDLSKPGSVPDYNPIVDSLFGRHTDRVPKDVGLQPRLGFTWTPTATATGAPRPSGDGNDMMRGRRRPLTFSGGIGAYRGAISASRIAGMVDQTGLPTTTRTLNCAGAAAPMPDWSNSNPLPEECIDGGAPEEYSISQPNVSVFDPSYRASMSWRGSLNMQSLEVRGLNIGLKANYSLNYNNESQVNLNMRDTPAFALASEGGRPIYVPVEGIVARTGAIAPGAGRVHSEFQRVNNLLSDLASRSSQVTLEVSPIQTNWEGTRVSFSYTWQHGSAQERGFQSSTGGDPFLKEWAPSRQATHQFSVNSRFRLWWFNLQARVNLNSGLPYTPMVAGDINGDGSSNDRAFIPNPATIQDAAFAEEFNTLLASTPASARECLERQFGQIAGRNSCRTPWQVTTDLGFEFNPPRNFGFGDRLRLTMNMQNATGALLRLTGLADSPLGRSAATGAPETRLLYVTGFDPETQQYSYRVNQLFGEREDFASRGRRFNPFQVNLGLEYRIGGPPSAPLARSLGLFPADRGPLLSQDQIRDRIRRLSNDPVAALIALEEKLRLEVHQVDRLKVIDSIYLARTDSLFAPLADYVFEKGRRVTDDEVRKRLGEATKGMQTILVEASTQAMAELSPEQQAQLPPTFAGRKPETVTTPPPERPRQ